MPVYDFFCRVCGYKFEQQLGFNDDPNTVHCPKCGANVRKIYTSPAIVFKGSGFYVNDSRKTKGAAQES